MYFKVKRDFWQIWLWNLAYIFLLLLWIPLTSHYLALFIPLFVATAVLYGLYLYRVISALCQLKKHVLIFRTGIYQYVILLDEIVSVERCHNIYSALALSTDRIRIATEDEGKQEIFYISVQENDKLFEILQKQVEENIKEKGEGTLLEENATDTALAIANEKAELDVKDTKEEKVAEPKIAKEKVAKQKKVSTTKEKVTKEKKETTKAANKTKETPKKQTKKADAKASEQKVEVQAEKENKAKRFSKTSENQT